MVSLSWGQNNYCDDVNTGSIPSEQILSSANYLPTKNVKNDLILKAFKETPNVSINGLNKDDLEYIGLRQVRIGEYDWDENLEGKGGFRFHTPSSMGKTFDLGSKVNISFSKMAFNVQPQGTNYATYYTYQIFKNGVLIRHGVFDQDGHHKETTTPKNRCINGRNCSGLSFDFNIGPCIEEDAGIYIVAVTGINDQGTANDVSTIVTWFATDVLNETVPAPRFEVVCEPGTYYLEVENPFFAQELAVRTNMFDSNQEPVFYSSCTNVFVVDSIVTEVDTNENGMTDGPLWRRVWYIYDSTSVFYVPLDIEEPLGTEELIQDYYIGYKLAENNKSCAVEDSIMDNIVYQPVVIAMIDYSKYYSEYLKGVPYLVKKDPGSTSCTDPTSFFILNYDDEAILQEASEDLRTDIQRYLDDLPVGSDLINITWIKVQRETINHDNINLIDGYTVDELYVPGLDKTIKGAYKKVCYNQIQPGIGGASAKFTKVISGEIKYEGFGNRDSVKRICNVPLESIVVKKHIPAPKSKVFVECESKEFVKIPSIGPDGQFYSKLLINSIDNKNTDILTAQSDGFFHVIPFGSENFNYNYQASINSDKYHYLIKYRSQNGEDSDVFGNASVVIIPSPEDLGQESGYLGEYPVYRPVVSSKTNPNYCMEPNSYKSLLYSDRFYDETRYDLSDYFEQLNNYLKVLAVASGGILEISIDGSQNSSDAFQQVWTPENKVFNYVDPLNQIEEPRACYYHLGQNRVRYSKGLIIPQTISLKSQKDSVLDQSDLSENSCFLNLISLDVYKALEPTQGDCENELANYIIADEGFTLNLALKLEECESMKTIMMCSNEDVWIGEEASPIVDLIKTYEWENTAFGPMNYAEEKGGGRERRVLFNQVPGNVGSGTFFQQTVTGIIGLEEDVYDNCFFLYKCDDCFGADTMVIDPDHGDMCEEVYLCPGEQRRLFIEDFDGNDPAFQYYWEPGIGLSSQIEAYPVVSYDDIKNSNPTTFTLKRRRTVELSVATDRIIYGTDENSWEIIGCVTVFPQKNGCSTGNPPIDSKCEVLYMESNQNMEVTPYEKFRQLENEWIPRIAMNDPRDFHPIVYEEKLSQNSIGVSTYVLNNESAGILVDPNQNVTDPNGNPTRLTHDARYCVTIVNTSYFDLNKKADIASKINEVKFKLYTENGANQIVISSNEFLSQADLELYDLSGRIISKRKFNNSNMFIMNSSKLPVGVYLLQLKYGTQKVEMFKIIKD
ncbi:MAG: hypothetical protein ACJATA_001018 [Sphingobacteriales bacterium]|jgi:hypothetical protein